MAEEVKVVETTPASTETQIQEKVKSSEVLRELSKKYGINMFEPDGIKAFEDMIAHKDVQLETTSKKYTELETQHKLFTEKQQEYQVKIEALQSGFMWKDETQYKELLALAKVNTKEGQTLADGFKVIKEKYKAMFSQNKDMGIQFSDVRGDQPDVQKTEQEKYLGTSQAVRKWQAQQAKYKK
jgi:DNA-binding transcriptional regulator YhcF (GntR family)